MIATPILIAANLVTSPPTRAYEGPRAVESARDSEIVVSPPNARDSDADIVARVEALRRLPAPPSSDHVDEPPSGRGLLVAGIVFATAGGIASIAAIAGVVTCGSCDEPDLALEAGLTATTFFLPTPFLFGAAARRREAARVHRDVVHHGRARFAPRRAMLAPGIVLASVGVAALGVSYAFWWTPGIGLRAGGAALAIGGSIWVGRLLGRRQGAKTRREASIAPMLGPSSGLAIAGRF